MSWRLSTVAITPAAKEIRAEREKSSRNLEARHATLDHYNLAAGHIKLLEGALLDLVERNRVRLPWREIDIALTCGFTTRQTTRRPIPGYIAFR